MKQKEEKQIEEEVKGENIFSTEWKNKQDKKISQLNNSSFWKKKIPFACRPVLRPPTAIHDLIFLISEFL